MNSNSRTQAGTSRPDAKRPFHRAAAWVMIVGLLLGGCGERRDAEVTPAASTPRPKASPPAALVQKPQVELAQMFTTAGVVVSSVKTPEELERIKPFRNVTLSRQPNGLKITATSGGPSVLLPEFRGESAIVQLVMDSPADTILEIFYLLPGQKSYGGANRIRQKIKAGRNVIYAQLPGQTWTGALRLDPGTVPGEYLIESFEAKTVSAAGAH